MKNQFCKFNKNLIPKWGWRDIYLWKFHSSNSPFEGGEATGTRRLWDYKKAYLIYNKDKIITAAYKEKIPVLLLAGVALNEVAGKPEHFKLYGVFPVYKLKDIYYKKSGKEISNATSIGSLAIQIRAAAETLGIEPSTLSTTQQLQLGLCLLDDDFNINIVAKHLKDLILYDNPGIKDTENLTEEEFIIAAARYNRGILRQRGDFVRAIEEVNAVPEAPVKEWISYGLDILKRKELIYQLIGIYK